MQQKWLDRILVFAIVAGICHASSAIEPVRPRVREAAVQGTFYPADWEELMREVDEHLQREPTQKVEGNVRGLIVPHAGYRYSAMVAGMGFSQLPLNVERVIILAPSHHLNMRGGGSIDDVDVYVNALGEVPVAPETKKMREKNGFFDYVPQAHEKEHALEVMLPFLQRKYNMFSLIPIVLGHTFDATAMAQSLLPLLESDSTILIASSDLSHYKPYETAQKLDTACLNAIVNMDVQALQKQELCGKAPVTVLMEVARLKKWQPKLIDYRNSGDTAGEKGSVVGYAALAFVEPQDSIAAVAEQRLQETIDPEQQQNDSKAGDGEPSYRGELLSSGEQTLLIDLVRRSIAAKLNQEELPVLPTYSETLVQSLGCFVTLNKNGKLRGCIGNILPVSPLVQAVQRNALNAAFNDRRFSPVTPEELNNITIEISVLTAPQELEYQNVDELLQVLKPNVHGVVLKKGDTRVSTYLPQVWSQIPQKEVFLSYLCRKGGLPADAWKQVQDVRVEVYEAFIFHENKDI